MRSVKLVPFLSTLILALTASVKSYEINAGEQIWRAGQSVEDGVANLSEHIGNALRRNTNAINPTADAPRRFFNYLGQQGRLDPSECVDLAKRSDTRCRNRSSQGTHTSQSNVEQRTDLQESFLRKVRGIQRNPVLGAEWNRWYELEIRRTETPEARALRQAERARELDRQYRLQGPRFGGPW
ncbi:hypothetical protein PHSY_005004 [Pseudozyma hubeiensis SY62]|uniref:Uncharacterized protein n=1 Tax=Pseudozyma hubeiensis (strain SY62) TaxID=1305764 RepID=R9P7P8_PSEHS|nr:hypothetical protein PHSY_005004 [Pseudozyma hubeiensis SY62]GAC97418.1 hypothetical protein PHSY_005004 [Pseudozyma hubeiensis SY62]